MELFRSVWFRRLKRAMGAQTTSMKRPSMPRVLRDQRPFRPLGAGLRQAADGPLSRSGVGQACAPWSEAFRDAVTWRRVGRADVGDDLVEARGLSKSFWRVRSEDSGVVFVSSAARLAMPMRRPSIRWTITYPLAF